MLSTSTSIYVPSGLCTSTSTEIRYSSTTSMSTKYSGPNPDSVPAANVYKVWIYQNIIFKEFLTCLKKKKVQLARLHIDVKWS